MPSCIRPIHWRAALTKTIVTVAVKKVRDNARRVVCRLPGIEVGARTVTVG